MTGQPAASQLSQSLQKSYTHLTFHDFHACDGHQAKVTGA